MLNNIINIIYNSSILIPFILSIGIVEIIKRNKESGIFFVIVFFILVILQFVLKNVVFKKLVPYKVNITNLTRDENTRLSAMYISYFVPFLQLILGNKIDIFTIVLIIIGVLLVIASHRGLENPIFKLLGYKTFHIETEHGVDYTLLSNREIRDIKSVGKVIRLTENRLMEV